jgi:hypothetical protein
VNVELHIEELVLHGFTPAEQRIGAAVERELARLFAEKGVPPALAHSAEVPSLNPTAFELNPHLGAEVVGAQVALSLYEGLAVRRDFSENGARGPGKRSRGSR